MSLFIGMGGNAYPPDYDDIELVLSFSDYVFYRKSLCPVEIVRVSL